MQPPSRRSADSPPRHPLIVSAKRAPKRKHCPAHGGRTQHAQHACASDAQHPVNPWHVGKDTVESRVSDRAYRALFAAFKGIWINIAAGIASLSVLLCRQRGWQPVDGARPLPGCKTYRSAEARTCRRSSARIAPSTPLSRLAAAHLLEIAWASPLVTASFALGAHRYRRL